MAENKSTASKNAADRKTANDKKAAEKRKQDSHASAPSGKMLLISALLIGVGGLWFVYELNPFGMMRGETEAETKERKDREKEEAFAKSHGGRTH